MLGLSLSLTSSRCPARPLPNTHQCHSNTPQPQPCKMGNLISGLLFQPPPATFLHPSRHFYLQTKTGSRIPVRRLRESTRERTHAREHTRENTRERTHALRVNVLRPHASAPLFPPACGSHPRSAHPLCPAGVLPGRRSSRDLPVQPRQRGGPRYDLRLVPRPGEVASRQRDVL